MQWLKADTAFTFRIGPFLDEDDGKTAETGLSIGQADIQISKNGGAFAQTSESTPTTTHDADGWYQCPLTTTDTNTEGPLIVQIHVSGALPVWREFMVVPANVYDSFFAVAGTDYLQVDIAEVSGDSTAADNLEEYCDGTTAQPVDVVRVDDSATAAANLELIALNAKGSDNKILLSATTHSGSIIPTVSNVSAVGDKTGYSISGTLTTLDALNNPSAADIADAVWDEESTDHTGAGKAGEQLWTDIDAVLDDTGSSGVVVADKTGFSISGTITTLDDLNDLSAAEVNSEVDTALADINLDHLVKSAVDTDFGTTVHDDSVIGHISATSDTAQFARSTDALQSIADNAVSSADVADAIWDEARSGHTTGGTFGEGVVVEELNTQAKADVNAEVDDVISTDTQTEESQGKPPVSPTVKQMLMYLYMALRNKVDVTSSLKEFHDDGGTVIWKKALSDSGTVYSEAEGVTGP